MCTCISAQSTKRTQPFQKIMESLTKQITEWLIANNAIEDVDKEVYEYAIYSMLITLSPLFLVFVIGIMMGTFIEGVFLIIPFMSIRKYSGGYHAKDFKTCFVTSSLILIACMYIASSANYGPWVSGGALVSVISLNIWSPIDSENRRLEQDEKKRYKRTTMCISFVFMCVHLLLLMITDKTYAISVAVGLMLSAGLQIPCILLIFRKRE